MVVRPNLLFIVLIKKKPFTYLRTLSVGLARVETVASQGCSVIFPVRCAEEGIVKQAPKADPLKSLGHTPREKFF